MQLSTLLPILISIIALILPGVLKSDAWALTKPWLNGLISGATIALFAGLAVWTGGNFSPDVLADWALFVAAYGALLAGPLKPLDEFLQSALNLPFLKPPPANPYPVRMPTQSPVPPRASAGQQESGSK